MNGIFFFPPVSAETPEVYKNNGVCNIIPRTVNRSCLKVGFWRWGGSISHKAAPLSHLLAAGSQSVVVRGEGAGLATPTVTCA